MPGTFSLTRIGRLVVLIAVLMLPGWLTIASAQNASLFRIATGLHNPRGIAVLPDNRLLVIEAGTGLQPDGRISFFADSNLDVVYDASEIQLLAGEFPSYNSLDRFNSGHDEPFGLSDILVTEDGRAFFTLDNPFAQQERPNSEFYIGNTGIFEVQLSDGSVTKFMDSPATLNSLTYDAQRRVFYYTESGFNRLGAVTLSGQSRIVAEFPDLVHDGQQAVPAGVTMDPATGDVLVALFSGHNRDYYGTDLAFHPGDAKVVRVDPDTGSVSDAVTGLTAAVDVAADEVGNIYVVEMTTQWPTANMPREFPLADPAAPPDPGGYVRFSGRVTMYAADGSAPVVLADRLDNPSNITYIGGILYVSAGLGTPGRSVLTADGISQITGEIFRIAGFR